MALKRLKSGQSPAIMLLSKKPIDRLNEKKVSFLVGQAKNPIFIQRPLFETEF